MTIEDHTKEPDTLLKAAGERFNPKGERSVCEDYLIHEHVMEVRVNGYLESRLSCTGDHLKELVIGRLSTSGLISGTEDIERLFICAKGNLAEVTLTEDISFEPYQGTEPTCCTGNRQFLSAAEKKEIKRLPGTGTELSVVFSLAERFREDSELHRKTGGTHSCYIYMAEGAIACFEDISRHNALDKAVGHMLLAGAEPSRCMLYTTGRVPADMVQKVLMARVPVLISKAVPTDAALELAKDNGLQLISRAWPDSYTVYH